MTKDCRVCISGHSDAEDIVSLARYHRKETEHFVFFERVSGNTEEKFSLKFGDGFLEYKRKGLIKTSVILRPGETTYSQYTTPYGVFEVGFETTDFNFEESDSQIRIGAEYRMTLNGEPHEEGKINVEISEVGT